MPLSVLAGSGECKSLGSTLCLFLDDVLTALTLTVTLNPHPKVRQPARRKAARLELQHVCAVPHGSDARPESPGAIRGASGG